MVIIMSLQTCNHDNMKSIMEDKSNVADVCFRDRARCCSSRVFLLLVYFGSVDVSFLNVFGCGGLQHLVIVEHHLPHQHHQLMQVLPLLQHKVTRVAGSWHKHIYILTRLKVEEKECIIIHVHTSVDTAVRINCVKAYCI